MPPLIWTIEIILGKILITSRYYGDDSIRHIFMCDSLDDVATAKKTVEKVTNERG